jgi:hypothetical protein
VKKIKPAELAACYYDAFHTEAGRIVFEDLKDLMQGEQPIEWQSLSHAELAARAAMKNNWEYINALATGVKQ